VQRHERLKTLFLECCELEGPARAELLDRECNGDAALRREVEAMLDFDTRRPDDRALGLTPHDEVPALPERIGPFRVIRLIGSGGMGSVYEVEQDRPRRRVALKLLHAGLPLASVVRRLEREGELLGRLRHPGIARIHESGRIETPFGPQPYLLMELVDGETLTRWARERQATARQRLELLARVCDAVQHAHEHGVVHRDLKPGNILVEADGAPRVLDFGIARATDGASLATLRTGTGEIVGTLAYMSPEQAAGDGATVDARSDVYSLGVLLHELLAGELPHAISDRSLPAAVDAIRNAEPRRLGDVQRMWRGDVETIALKALEKDPARRYATAAALAADLRRHLDEQPIEARPPSRAYRVQKYVRRHRVPVLAAAAVMLTLAGGGAVALRFAQGEAAQRERAGRSDAEARTADYQSGLLAAQRLMEDGGFPAARGQLDALPADLRGWDWGALDRLNQRQLAELSVPDVWGAAWVDRQRVVVVDECTQRTLWDPLARTREPLDAVAPDARPIGLSPDGRWLLSWVAAEGEFVLSDTLVSGAGTRWPLPDGLVADAKGVLPSPSDGGRACAVATDGRRFAVAFTDGRLWLADIEGQPTWTRLTGPGSPWISLVYAPDGRRLAAGTRKAFYVYDAESTERLLYMKHNDVAFHGATWDDTGESVFVSLDGRLWQMDPVAATPIDSWTTSALKMQHFGVAVDVACLPAVAADAGNDGVHVALLFNEGTTWLMDLATQRLWGSFKHADRSQSQMSLARAPDGDTLLTCGRVDDSVRVWSAAPLDTEVLGRTEQSVYPLAISPDGLLVATGAWDGMARLWEIPGGRPVAALAHGSKRVEALSFSPDGRTLACGLGVEGLATWDLRTGRQLVRRDDLECGAVAWSPDGTQLAAGHDDALLLLDPLTLQERLVLRPVGNYTTAVAWSPDGRLVAAGSRNGRLALHDAASGTQLAYLKGSAGGVWEWTGLRSLAFSPDGLRLATGWGAWPLVVYDVPGLAVLQQLQGHSGEIFSVAWSPDGRRLAAGGRDNLLRLWNPDTGALLLSLARHGDYIYSLAFTPDGRRLVTGSGDGTVRIWDSERAELRWKERSYADAARIELEELVDGLLAELGDPAAVAARLVALPELDAVRRRIALDVLLERVVRVPEPSGS
jgi:eukaryotic-like serine/threonine-protein kinase